jgi:hypothetical protein
MSLLQYYRLIQSQEKDKQDTTREELYKSLSTLSKNAKGPWFMGEEFGLVDIALAPFVSRDYIIRDHRGYVRNDVGNGWTAYAEKLESRDSVIRTTSVSPSFMPKEVSSHLLKFRRTSNTTRRYMVDIYVMKLRARWPRRRGLGGLFLEEFDQ